MIKIMIRIQDYSKLKIKIMVHVQGYVQDYDVAWLPPQSWLCSLALSHV